MSKDDAAGPPYRDREGALHAPDKHDLVTGLSICGALIERRVEGRRLRDVLLVKAGMTWRLPGCDLRPGTPVKTALLSALKRQVGPQVQPKDLWREPLSGRVFEEFLYEPLDHKRGDHVHVLVNVFELELDGMWRPKEGDGLMWANWNDLSRYDIAPEFVTALSEYKADRIGAIRL